jgi:hypothetical protein
MRNISDKQTVTRPCGTSSCRKAKFQSMPLLGGDDIRAHQLIIIKPIIAMMVVIADTLINYKCV